MNDQDFHLLYEQNVADLKRALAYHYANVTYACWSNNGLYHTLSDTPLARCKNAGRQNGVTTWHLFSGTYNEALDWFPDTHIIKAATVRDFVEAADILLTNPVRRVSSQIIGQYEHYKGDLYELTGMGLDTELDIPTYDYNTVGGFTTFHRHAHMWNEIIDGLSSDNPPEPYITRRFTLIER